EPGCRDAGSGQESRSQEGTGEESFRKAGSSQSRRQEGSGEKGSRQSCRQEGRKEGVGPKSAGKKAGYEEKCEAAQIGHENCAGRSGSRPALRTHTVAGALGVPIGTGSVARPASWATILTSS